MEFRLLGPVEVWISSNPVTLGGTKPKALLATLLLEHGRVVPMTRLIDVLWGDSPPRTARDVIQTYVKSLRRVFAEQGHDDVIPQAVADLLRHSLALWRRPAWRRHPARTGGGTAGGDVAAPRSRSASPPTRRSGSMSESRPADDVGRPASHQREASQPADGDPVSTRAAGRCARALS